MSTGTRYSRTLGTDLLYVAVPVASGGVVHGAARITHPTSEVDERVRRYWLILAVATLWTVAVGTRVEDAWQRGQLPAARRRPVPWQPGPPRVLSVFRRGLLAVRQQVARGRLWRRLWLTPQAWPEPPPDLQIVYHQPLTPSGTPVTSPC